MPEPRDHRPHDMRRRAPQRSRATGEMVIRPPQTADGEPRRWLGLPRSTAITLALGVVLGIAAVLNQTVDLAMRPVVGIGALVIIVSLFRWDPMVVRGAPTRYARIAGRVGLSLLTARVLWWLVLAGVLIAGYFWTRSS
jgi:hypothetical protein